MSTPEPIQRPTPKILRDFIHFIRTYWNRFPDPYDPEALWDTFNVYWRFLKIFADPKLTEVNDVQWKAYEISIKEPESVDWRTRRGGKSMSFAVLGPFFSIIRFGEYEGFGIYRAPYENQLKQFEKWMRKNPFVTKISRTKHQIDILDSEGIDYAQISESTTASLGASFALLDEEKKIQKGTKLYDLAIELRGILIEGDITHKRIIHKSTGGANTLWEDIVLRAEAEQRRTGRQCLIVIPWTECDWITRRSIEREMEMNLHAPWYIDQEYNCLNVPIGGNFFDPKLLHIVDPSYFREKGIHVAMCGIDFNGPLVGHIVVLGNRIGRNVYVIEEKRIDDIEELHHFIKSLAHNNISIEAEDIGYNAGFVDHLKKLRTPARYVPFTSDLKERRLAILQQSDIYVAEGAMWTIKNLKEARYDEKSLYPKLKKMPDQHGLDATLHMIHVPEPITFADPIELSHKRYDPLVNPWGIF